MDIPVPVLVLAAATMLAVGGYLAVGLPRAIRQPGGSVLAKILGAIMLLGGACGLLGLGGTIIAALVGAAPVAMWLGTTFFVGAGAVALSVLGLVMLAIWRRLVVKERTAGGR
jgi:hypothetical protein